MLVGEVWTRDLFMTLIMTLKPPYDSHLLHMMYPIEIRYLGFGSLSI